MYKNILIATDGSELADKAVTDGLTLAKHTGAKVTLVTVTEIWNAREMAARIEQGTKNPIEQFEAKAAEAAGKALDAAKAKADELGVPCETIHVPDQHPADGIIRTAENYNCDLIIMASHGYRGVKRILLGSVANEVLTHSSIPVLIHR